MKLEGWHAFWAGLGLLTLTLGFALAVLEGPKKAVRWVASVVFVVAVITGVVYSLYLLFRSFT